MNKEKIVFADIHHSLKIIFSRVLKKSAEVKNLTPYSQHFIFFVSYELAEYDRAFVSGKHL